MTDAGPAMGDTLAMDDVIMGLGEDDDEFDMPLAANAENKALHRQVKAMERELIEIDADIDANNERVKAMDSHLHNVEQEAKLLKGVADARDGEITSIRNMALLAKRERTQLQKTMQEIKKTNEENTQQQNTLQNDIFMCQQQIDTLQEQLAFDEEQLKAWMESARQQEEDAEVLRKYERADEARVKELTLQIERLAVEAKKHQHILETEVTNTRSHELGLDKVAELFRGAHAERVQLIQQWETTVQQMQAEDGAIDEATETFQRLKAESKKFALEVAEQEGFLEQQNQATAEVEASSEKQERLLGRLENARTDAIAQLERFQTERDSIQNVIARTSTDAQSKAQEVEALKTAIRGKEKRLAQLASEVEHVQDDLEDKQMENMSIEERTRALEVQLEEETKEAADVERALSAASKELAKIMQRGHALKQQEAQVHGEISGIVQRDRNLVSKTRAAEKQSASEEQIMYRQDFKVAVLERKLLSMEGTVIDEKSKQLELEVARLKDVLAGHMETKRLLVTQLRRVEDDTRVARKRKDTLANEHAVLTDKLAHVELYNKGAQKELDKVIEDKQNLMVDENLLRLEIRRLRKLLNTRADDVLSLEQRKLQLKVAMEERMHEIKLHKELLTVQKLECTKLRASASKELQERNVRIDQLKKKHEIVSFSMKSVGEDGEEQSEAYLIVKAAQEREELQQKGDEMDATIRKREKELRMLDNTLRLMNGHNAKYKSSLSRVDAESEELAHKQHLEGQLRTAVDKYKHKRRELRLCQDDLAEKRDAYRIVSNDLDNTRQNVITLTAELQALERELADQEGKRSRAMAQADKAVTAYRKELAADGETVAEKDFSLREMKDNNNKVLDMIDDVVGKMPDLRPEISLLYDRASIKRAPQRVSVSRGGSSIASSKYSARSSSSRTSARSRSTANEAASSAQRERAVTPRTVDLGLGIQGMGGGRK